MSMRTFLAILVLCGLLAVGSAALADPTTAPARCTSRLSALPLQTAAVLVTIVVGIPVNAVRRPIANEKYGVAQLNGDNDAPCVKIPAAVFYAPLALMAGILESPWYAVNNSLLYYDKPFSKEQFSLAEPEEPKQ